MSGRLAGELSLLAAAATLLRAVWDGWRLDEAIETVLWAGLIAWVAGYAAGEILRRVAIEHVAAELAAGATPDEQPAETTPPSQPTA